MTQKIKDRFIGVIVTLASSSIAFMAYSFFDSKVSRAEYNRGFEILRINQEYIKRDISDLKKAIDETTKKD
jgi:hypothetical protein